MLTFDVLVLVVGGGVQERAARAGRLSELKQATAGAAAEAAAHQRRRWLLRTTAHHPDYEGGEEAGDAAGRRPQLCQWWQPQSPLPSPPPSQQPNPPQQRQQPATHRPAPVPPQPNLQLQLLKSMEPLQRHQRSETAMTTAADGNAASPPHRQAPPPMPAAHLQAGEQPLATQMREAFTETAVAISSRAAAAHEAREARNAHDAHNAAVVSSAAGGAAISNLLAPSLISH